MRSFTATELPSEYKPSKLWFPTAHYAFFLRTKHEKWTSTSSNRTVKRIESTANKTHFSRNGWDCRLALWEWTKRRPIQTGQSHIVTKIQNQCKKGHALKQLFNELWLIKRKARKAKSSCVRELKNSHSVQNGQPINLEKCKFLS